MVLKKHLKIRKFSGNINIDENSNEWPKTKPILLYKKNDKKPFVKIDLCYNRNYFFINASVNDKEIVDKYTDSMIFLNVTLIVSFDRMLKLLTHENNDMQLEFSNTKEGVAICNRALNEKIDIEKSGIKVKIVKSKGNTIIYEIALPSSFLKPLILAKGTKFGLNLAINDFDKKGNRNVIEWPPGIGFIGIDDTYQSQLHFAEI